MWDFLKSDSFMKLVWTVIAVTFIVYGFLNKQEVIDLYKFTIERVFN